MNILSFDTGLNKTYLALTIDENIYTHTIESTKEKYHSAFLIKKTVELLESHNLRLQDIDIIATTIGPGSFTGIRVGLTVARGIVQFTKAKAVGVTSLELIAKTYGLPAICVLDARKNKAYVGNSENVELVELEDLPNKLKDFQGKIIADTNMQKFLSENNISSINFEEETKDYARILSNIAKEKYNEGKYSDWQQLKPLYIQPPPIHQKKN